MNNYCDIITWNSILQPFSILFSLLLYQVYRSMGERLCNEKWNARELATQYFPHFECYNKLLALDTANVASPEDLANCYKEDDSITFTRWSTFSLPEKLSPSDFNTIHSAKQDIFTYPNYNRNTEYHWHLNFANQMLFIAYGGSLYAQDEMQCLEHPILGSVQRKLATNRSIMMFTRANNRATPILIEGVDRKLTIAVNPDSSKGRPFGLYGNNFNRANEETILKALTVFPVDLDQSLRPRSNIIAMEAPPGGYGNYKATQIKDILETAYSGYRAAVLQTEEYKKSKGLNSLDCVVHTGHWGTGAYGGNRVLMAFLQLFAADMAGVDIFMFHTFDQIGMNDYNEALNLWKSVQKECKSPGEVIRLLMSKKFNWGVSDGN